MGSESETVFSRIIKREIPADIEFESGSVIAFHDINPVAPVHILIAPKKPLKDISSADPKDQALLGELLLTAKKIADERKLAADGFRLVINTGEKAGQTVPHLHMHLLAGRHFTWPPG